MRLASWRRVICFFAVESNAYLWFNAKIICDMKLCSRSTSSLSFYSSAQLREALACKIQLIGWVGR